MNNQSHHEAQEAIDTPELQEQLQAEKLPYHAPQLVVHGKLERLTQGDPSETPNPL